MLSGLIPSLNHGTRVPFSIEMLEADFVPMDLNTTTPVTTVQGVEINAWGSIRAWLRRWERFHRDGWLSPSPHSQMS